MGKTFFFFFLKNEIISKTRIIILSHYLNNGKSKILNPNVRKEIPPPRRSKISGAGDISRSDIDFRVLIVTRVDSRHVTGSAN